ncbi:MAG: hypothetical protein U9R14_02405 [Patescibacteria group bacterium]|nr:hypothetical protein [Patescibacteria group bacterium]
MGVPTITLPKTEYQRLKLQSKAYQKIMGKFFELAVKEPLWQIVDDFRKTNIYTEDFLKDLENGLKKSSYLRHYENKTPAKRS